MEFLKSKPRQLFYWNLFEPQIGPREVFSSYTASEPSWFQQIRVITSTVYGSERRPDQKEGRKDPARREWDGVCHATLPQLTSWSSDNSLWCPDVFDAGSVFLDLTFVATFVAR